MNPVGYDNHTAPRIAIPENVARNVTMSSREIAELTGKISSGEASTPVAYEAGMKMVGYACSLAGGLDYSKIPGMSMDQAHAELDKVEHARLYAITIAQMFEKYALVADAAKNLANVIRFAESHLIPALLLGCARHEKTRPSASTYIIRNPKSKLIKIGKTVDLKTRISTLQTGAGAPLEILSVIDGDVERDLHKAFAEFRVHGEWFSDELGAISTFAMSKRGEA